MKRKSTTVIKPCYLVDIKEKIVEADVEKTNKRNDVTYLGLIDTTLPKINRFLTDADFFA